MRELVGTCHKCSKEVYCLDGFLNGFVDEHSRLTCFSCEEQQEQQGQHSQPDQQN